MIWALGHLCVHRLNWAKRTSLKWWIRLHCHLDTRFKIRALEVGGRERYFSVTEALHNTTSLRGAETFGIFSFMQLQWFLFIMFIVSIFLNLLWVQIWLRISAQLGFSQHSIYENNWIEYIWLGEHFITFVQNTIYIHGSYRSNVTTGLFVYFCF